MDMLLFQNLSVTGACLPLVVLLFIVYYFRSRDPNRSRYPPGPGCALPVIGNLYQIGTKPHLTFLKWKKQYGPLIFIKFASENTVIVNDAKVMTELYSTAVASGRPKSPFWKIFSNSGHGIINSDGEDGKEQRAFAVKTLHELGLSKSGKLEGIILENADSIVKYFEHRVGIPFRATRLFNGAIVSTLWSIVAGEKVEWLEDGQVTETEISKHSRKFLEGLNLAMKFGLVAMPGLRFLPVFGSVWNGYKSAQDNFHRMAEIRIQNHAETLDVLSPRDFIDHGLIKIQSTTDPSSSFYREKGRLNLRTAVKDLFLAGSETMSTGMEYIVMYLGAHPKIQAKLHKALDAVIGGRYPTLSDRKMLPYAEAVIMETLRRSATGTVKTNRILEDFEYRGYLLPKDTFILGDMYGVLRDSETWGEEVDVFRPERFLNEDETGVVHHESWLPFSPGRRNCIGDTLALDQLFLFTTCIFQKFRVEVVHDGTFDLDDVKPGFTLEHLPFDIRVFRRNNN